MKLVAMSEGKPTATRGTYTPRKIRPRHRIAVMLQEAGWRNKDIARALGYTEARVSVILGSSNPGLREMRAKFASEVADNIHDVQTRMKLYANEMLDRMIAHARQDQDRPLSRLAARDILHMAGFSPVKKQFTMESKVPFDEMKKVIGAINEANEVVMRQGEWEVKETKSA